MKKAINKRAQVYGLSSFIYAIAIAVILLIGLIGMAKDFETKSQAADYRHDVTMATRSAETVKKIMEQERGYALDKALFFTGTLGGVSRYNGRDGYVHPHDEGRHGPVYHGAKADGGQCRRTQPAHHDHVHGGGQVLHEPGQHGRPGQDKDRLPDGYVEQVVGRYSNSFICPGFR